METKLLLNETDFDKITNIVLRLVIKNAEKNNCNYARAKRYTMNRLLNECPKVINAWILDYENKTRVMDLAN